MSDHDEAALHLGCGSPITFSAIEPGDVVLHLGCDAGTDLLLAAAKVGPTGRVIGVDTVIERASANVTEAGLDRVEVRSGKNEKLPVADGAVDWVISNGALSRSSDKARVCAEIARVLKTGGQIWATEVVAEGLPKWLRRSDALRDSPLSLATGEGEYVAGLCAAGLAELSVGGRYVYDRDQLTQIVPWTERASGRPSHVVDGLVGHVWSVYISGVKVPVDT